MARIMVTGINGFVGKHLAHELHAQNHKVVGVGNDAQINAQLGDVVDDYQSCDLTDAAAVAGLNLEDVDAIISLAGLAKPRESFSREDLYHHVNVAVLTTLGERLIKEDLKIRVLAISTGNVYDSHQPMPLTEESKLTTESSPYAMSKIAMEEAAQDLCERGLDCVIVRPFNHIGPGQEPGLLVPDVYENIVRAAETDAILRVGDLTTKRDFTDVRDVVKAYVGLAVHDKLDHAIYNVAQGYSTETGKIVDLLLEETGMTDKITRQVDPAFIRPNDPKDLYGDTSRIKQAIGWEPQIPLQQTIKDFVASKQ